MSNFSPRRPANASGAASASPDLSAVLFSPGYVFGEPTYDIENTGGSAVSSESLAATPPTSGANDEAPWVEEPADETPSPISGNSTQTNDGIWFPLWDGSSQLIMNAPDGRELHSLWFPYLGAVVDIAANLSSLQSAKYNMICKRGSAQLANLSFPYLPTVGNTVVFLITGASGRASIPSGFEELSYTEIVPGAAIRTISKVVTQADTAYAAYAFAGAQNQNLLGIELPQGTTFTLVSDRGTLTDYPNTRSEMTIIQPNDGPVIWAVSQDGTLAPLNPEEQGHFLGDYSANGGDHYGYAYITSDLPANSSVTQVCDWADQQKTNKTPSQPYFAAMLFSGSVFLARREIITTKSIPLTANLGYAYLELQAGVGGGTLLRRIQLQTASPETVPLPRGIASVTISLCVRALSEGLPVPNQTLDFSRASFERPIDVFASSLRFQPGGPGWGGDASQHAPPPPIGLH